ncbi:MAG: galactonate dehydratase [Firmicutes bacterium]|nr:galactonate dehydratase [Bacillota bacterium]
MKITRLKLTMVKPRWMFLEMYTDKDIIGYGEPILEGHAHAVAAVVHELEDYLIGKDPRTIEHHWQAMYRGGFYRGGPVLTSAISGIEQAMWDILGKSLGVPVYQLLGGACRSKIRMYAHVGGATAEELVTNARARVGEGFKAIKMTFDAPIHFMESQDFIEQCVEKFKAVRNAVGKSIDTAIDFHGRFSPALSKRLIRALEPYYPYFIEEPCLPENVDAMADIARSTTIPIATGERLYTKWGFLKVLEKGAASILQPDLCHAGGIMECKKIAAMAETYYASVAPHNPLGPIALAVSLQLDACVPNFLMQEQVTFGEGYLKQPFVMEDGYVRVPEDAGFGIELDEQAIKEKEYDGWWNTPRVYHNDDGSVADW